MRQLLVIAVLLVPLSAQAQILQSGPIVSGHVIKSPASNVGNDAGGAANGPSGANATELGLTKPNGAPNGPPPFSVNDGPTDSTSGWHSLTVDINPTTGVIFDAEPHGAASPVNGYTFRLNGINYPFPGAGNGNAIMPTSPAITAGHQLKAGGSTTISDAGIQLGINVTDPTYGADPTGIADSTTALQAAFTAAATSLNRAVFFPSGTYRWTSALNASGITVSCQGNNNTFLLFDDTSGTADGMTIGHSTFNMDDCNYDRKQNGSAGALLHFTDSFWSSVYNNRFTGGHAWDIITVDSSAVEPNEIFVHDNITSTFLHDFVFLNSQNASFPVYDFHAHDNFSLSTGGNAMYEVAGYGQIELHGNTMGGAAYDVYIHTANAPSINVLSHISNNDLDVATTTSLYVSNQNDLQVTDNIIGGITLVNIGGAVFTGNQAACGSNTCPMLLQGVASLDFTGNRISGQNNPITIQPAGSTKSQDLHFDGNTWNYGTGSFLTFSGGAPAASNIRVSQMLEGAETLATFTTAPTNFRNMGDTGGPATPPTITTCTGVGATGTCAMATNSTAQRGTISINTAGNGEAGTGTITMLYNSIVGPTFSTCQLTPQNSSGFWSGPVSLIQQGTNTTSMTFIWVNAGSTPLTDAVQYNVEYACQGM